MPRSTDSSATYTNTATTATTVVTAALLARLSDTSLVLNGYGSLLYINNIDPAAATAVDKGHWKLTQVRLEHYTALRKSPVFGSFVTTEPAATRVCRLFVNPNGYWSSNHQKLEDAFNILKCTSVEEDEDSVYNVNECQELY